MRIEMEVVSYMMHHKFFYRLSQRLSFYHTRKLAVCQKRVELDLCNWVHHKSRFKFYCVSSVPF